METTMRDLALHALSLLRDKDGKEIMDVILQGQGQIPPEIYLCVDGMGLAGKLHGNLPVIQVPDVDEPEQLAWSIQFPEYEKCVYVTEKGEIIELTNAESFKKDPSVHKSLDLILSWLTCSTQMIIHLIEDECQKEEVWKQFWLKKLAE